LGGKKKKRNEKRRFALSIATSQQKICLGKRGNQEENKKNWFGGSRTSQLGKKASPLTEFRPLHQSKKGPVVCWGGKRKPV